MTRCGISIPITCGISRNIWGTGLYVVLFAIIFCETGLVVWPFLPGDSLLFTVGAVAATGGINLPFTAVLLCIAANCGDLLNYTIGNRIGPKIFSAEGSKFLSKKHLLDAHEFYEKYGPKTIIIARFVPIIRTFAPFVAGIGKMHFGTFELYSVAGGAFLGDRVPFRWILFGQYRFYQKTFRDHDSHNYRDIDHSGADRIHQSPSPGGKTMSRTYPTDKDAGRLRRKFYRPIAFCRGVT